jgi:hypothetical protein
MLSVELCSLGRCWWKLPSSFPFSLISTLFLAVLFGLAGTATLIGGISSKGIPSGEGSSVECYMVEIGELEAPVERVMTGKVRTLDLGFLEFFFLTKLQLWLHL